jgi:hypothetical protein
VLQQGCCCTCTDRSMPYCITVHVLQLQTQESDNHRLSVVGPCSRRERPASVLSHPHHVRNRCRKHQPSVEHAPLHITGNNSIYRDTRQARCNHAPANQARMLAGSGSRAAKAVLQPAAPNSEQCCLETPPRTHRAQPFTMI